MPRAENWTIADLLDFEYLLTTEREGGDDAGAARDKVIFARDIAPQLGGTRRDDRRFIFKRWLDAHRAGSSSTLPGQHYRSSSQILLTLAVLIGVGVGVGVTTGLLHYRGDEPVNVAWLFATTVGVQWLLLLVAAALWLVRRSTGLLDEFRPLHGLIQAILWAFSAGLRRLPGEKRERIRAVLARMGQRHEIYGSLATWPALIVTQLFGVCFNLGVLATLLLHVSLSDVAFGWQSTLQLSEQGAFRIVSAISQPWAFAPNAHPSLDQVVASKFSYSEGIRPLSQSAMASWWPFLCYSVLVYGLLVRALLLTWSMVKLRRALGAITFGHHGCHALHRRLTGSMIQAESDTPSLEIPSTPIGSPARSPGSCLALVAQGLTLDPTMLEATVSRAFGWTLAGTLAVQIDHPSGNLPALAELSARATSLAAVTVVVPARRAPIKAIALFLQKVVTASGGKPEIVVMLTGRSDDHGFGAVTEEEFSHWRNLIAIHGLAVSLEKWPAA